MITHIAIYKFKEVHTEEEINKVLLGIKELKNKVCGIKEILVGKNYSKWNKGYTHAIMILACTQKAMDAYRSHPDHLALAKIFDEMEDKGIGIDFKAM